jgi:hypothetical protein
MSRIGHVHGGGDGILEWQEAAIVTAGFSQLEQAAFGILNLFLRAMSTGAS